MASAALYSRKASAFLPAIKNAFPRLLHASADGLTCFALSRKPMAPSTSPVWANRKPRFESALYERGSIVRASSR